MKILSNMLCGLSCRPWDDSGDELFEDAGVPGTSLIGEVEAELGMDLPR
jgi:hypothetical protein